MEARIQSVKFDATEKLQAYINKKLEKLAKFNEAIDTADVTLRVVKPESEVNKEVSVELSLRGKKIFASKTENSFEQAFDDCCEALEKQLEKYKNQH